jgi:RecA-family ATPase
MDFHGDSDPDPADAPAFGGSGRSKPRKTPPQFTIINPADLQFKPVRPREWIVPDWLPVGTVTANYGDGGTGKTLLAQQLMTSCAAGTPWCGIETMQCRSLGLFCEDDEDEIHGRQASINEAFGLQYTSLEQMRWISGVGADNTLINFTSDGRMHATKLFDDFSEAAKDYRARLLVFDTAADLFAGNENDRHQVRQFINLLAGLAVELKGAALLNAHPSRSGIASGNLDGGSTAWSNSVRSRWSLARPTANDGGNTELDTNERILTRRKANYASIGDTIRLEWRKGLLLPPQSSGGFGAAGRAAADAVFLDLLALRYAQGVFVSHNTRAGNYAPKTFGKCSERQGYAVKDFESAMGRLFEQRRIVAENYGRPGDVRQRIAIVG